MNPKQQQLVDNYLDGELSEGDLAELNDWIKASPENAAEFAKRVRFHDCLHGVIQANAISNEMLSIHRDSAPATIHPSSQRYRHFGKVGALAALCAVMLFVLWMSIPQQASAATELDRLIEKASEGRDRSYRISNLDAVPEQPEERRPPIDGAMLYVRQPDQYVLVRKFPDGRPFVTGSDGRRSWSVPPNGAVRVSSDPLRFRGPVPGNQHGILFVDLRADLVQLRDAYVVSTLGSDAAGSRGILAVKKSVEYRGPNRVEIWYDAASGVIIRIKFAGMPRARGGPDSVAVELLEQRDLGDDLFFVHESYHAADRRVIEED